MSEAKKDLDAATASLQRAWVKLNVTRERKLEEISEIEKQIYRIYPIISKIAS